MTKETIFKFKQNILGPLKKVFRVLWPPEAKNDLHSENTKKNQFQKDFFVFYAKMSFSAPGGRKMAIEIIFKSKQKIFVPSE